MNFLTIKNFFIILFSFFVLSFFFNRGFAYYDEGFILHAAQRVIQGELPYRDFDLIYTPGTVFLTAAAFKIFGESILAGRVLALLVSLLTGYLVFKICYRTTKNNFVSFLALLIYLVWGPTHINFPWPSMFALTAGLATLLAWPNFLVVGLMTLITLILKQNFGIAVFLTVIIQMSLMGQIGKIRQFRNFSKFIFGFSVGTLVFLIYLLSTGSLEGFLNNFYFYTVKRFLLEGVASTSFPTGLKGIFYLLPVTISVAAIFLLRKKPKMLIFPLFTLLFYLFGIRPTSDYPHLSVLMAITGIPLALILGNSKQILDALQKSSLTRMTRFAKAPARRTSFRHFDQTQYLEPVERLVQNLFNTLVYGSILVIIILGFYTGLFKNYYRWDSPLYKQNSFSDQTKAKIFVDQKFNRVIPEVVGEIKKNSTKNDYIFIFPNAPMFYFLTDRKNPTRYINLPLGLHSPGQEREVVDNLKKKRIRLILTNEPPENSNYHIVSEYILKNYLKKKEFFEFTLWEKFENEKRSEVLSI